MDFKLGDRFVLRTECRHLDQFEGARIVYEVLAIDQGYLYSTSTLGVALAFDPDEVKKVA